MDLSTIKPHLHTLDVVLPGTAQRLGLTLKIQPLSSPACQAVLKTNRAKTQAARDAGITLSEEDLSAQALALYAASVASWAWEDGTHWNGAVPELTPEAVADVLTEADFILHQVVAVHEDQRLFFADYVTS